MSLVTAKKLGVHNAKNFIDVVNEPTLNTNLYLVISHEQPWANDSSPDVPVDSRREIIDLWRNIFAGKKITGNDLTLVIPRIDWTNNTPYAAYTDTANTIYGTNFYVMTSDFNVYKCLSNNNNANSTTMPTYTTFNKTNQEVDGYIWKYMFTLNTNDRVRYLTDSYIPIRTLLFNDGSLQWQVQTYAVDGAIDAIFVSNSGINYTNSSNISISITGDGTSANAIATVNTTTNTISSIIVTNPGSGYHFANVSISGGGGSNATFRAIISPPGGHGSDPASELGGSNVLINTRLKGTESDLIVVQNDYRQIGIIKNPIAYGTSNTLFSNTVFSQTTDILVSAGAGDYILDEYVYQGTSISTASFSGRVVSWDSTNNQISVVEVTGTPTSATLSGLTSGITRFVISTTNPDLVQYSGDVLYIENIIPIQRASDSTEDIKLFLRF